MDRFSNIIIRDKNETKKVKISSSLKPELQNNVIDKWQSLIDTAARIAQVPSGLIMRLNEKTIEVFLKSNTKGNPYKKGEEAKLIYGLYCETVIGTQQKLIVPDATKNDIWGQDNPDVDINMISYMGFPVNWPDGEIFGTVCLLDNKENKYNHDYEDLLSQIKLHLESDLEILFLNNDLKEKNFQLQKSNSIKSKFLSLISHDIRGSVATIDDFIKMIINEFDDYDSSQLKLILNSLGQNASSSREVLEDLLSWSRNEILELEPDMKFVDIIDVFEKVLFYFKQPIQMKGIKIIKAYDTKKAFISADENMITVIFRNIISNAIKYNYKNGEIRIKVVSVGDKYEIGIEDTGTGMDNDTIDKLFKYNENHAKGTHGESSAGIGLILTKEFLDKLDAKISVTSEREEGSNFKIEIKGHNNV
jgi:signal transduction histidine kinase